MDGYDGVIIAISVLGVLQTLQLFILGDLRQRIYRLEDKIMNKR